MQTQINHNILQRLIISPSRQPVKYNYVTISSLKKRRREKKNNMKTYIQNNIHNIIIING